jgi:predicted nucleic acid-binding protein
MSAFVLDTSIALKWFLDDENDRNYSLPILEAITDEYRPIVPWLWYYEIASTLLTQVRRKRVEFEKILLYLNIIDEMVIDIDPPDSSAILQLPYLARTYNLTGYDAAFLELAKTSSSAVDDSRQSITGSCVRIRRPSFVHAQRVR